MCPVHEDDKIMNKVYARKLKHGPPLDNLRQGAMQDAMDPAFNEETILSPRPRPDLSKIKRRLLDVTTLGQVATVDHLRSPKGFLRGRHSKSSLVYLIYHGRLKVSIRVNR